MNGSLATSQKTRRDWLVIVGFAPPPRAIDSENPLVRVVHRDNLARAREVLESRGYDYNVHLYACATATVARICANKINDWQDAVASGVKTKLRIVRRQLVASGQAVRARTAPAEDPFGYFNGHYDPPRRPR